MCSDPNDLSAVLSSTKLRHQVADWKQYATEDGAAKIDIVSSTMLSSPLHPRKQMKRLENMSKHHGHERTCPDNLQDIAKPLSPGDENR